MQRSVTVTIGRLGYLCFTAMMTCSDPLGAQGVFKPAQALYTEQSEPPDQKNKSNQLDQFKPINLSEQTRSDEPLKPIDRTKQIIHSLSGALDQFYLNRIKSYLNVPIVGQFKLTSNYGSRHDPVTGEVRSHQGIDLAASSGTPIIAVAGGVVLKATRHQTLGNYVEIQHAPTWRTRYAHARLLYVVAGQKVAAGQFIGQVGSTGRSTGPHLHFEVWRNDKPIHPFLVIDSLSKGQTGFAGSYPAVH